jgi:hypothetical protein
VVFFVIPAPVILFNACCAVPAAKALAGAVALLCGNKSIQQL